FLECKICNVPYDEDSHRPRTAVCGHDICTACLKVLIKGSIFECPKCRQTNKVEVPEDITINFGLIDAIREFQDKNISLNQDTEPKLAEAAKDWVCKVHSKSIEYRCLKCQMWLCEAEGCLDSHSDLSGCSTMKVTIAVNIMKEDLTKNTNMVLTLLNKDATNVSYMIKEHTDMKNELLEKAKKLDEEVEKLRNLLEQGNSHKHNLVESTNHLKSAGSPHGVMERIEVLAQRKQSMLSWAIKNLKSDSLLYLLKALEEGKALYVEIIINEEKRHAKVSQYKENICLHSFLTQSVAEDLTCLPFQRLQKMIFEDASLIFLELSQHGIMKGRATVRLCKDMPNIRENIVQIVTGQQGPPLNGMSFDYRNYENIGINNLQYS
ncbi:unnamed protein product, partial [Meganyctiphanes norvegica]